MSEELVLLGVTQDDLGHVLLDDVDLEGRMIQMGDLMKAGHCVPGIKTWFTEKDMDWRQLLRGGYPASDLALTGDGLMLSAIRTILKKG